MEEWTTKFYNLGGNTIFENRKNFYAYVKDLHENPPDIDLLVETLVPRNTKEELYIVHIIKAFNKEQHLMRLLVSGNTFIVRHILKKTKINLLAITPNDFITNICPQLSTSAKRTWIQKLSTFPMAPELAENYFNAIVEKYDIPLASPLLGNCSVNYIKSVLSNHKIKIPERQLIELHKQSPDFLQYYFKSQKEGYFTKCPMLARHLIEHHPQAFHELLHFGKPKVRGKAFIKYLQQYKHSWLKIPSRLEITTRMLKKISLTQQEFQQHFTNILPDKLTSFQMYDLRAYLLLRPKSQRGSILFNSFQAKYKLNFLETTDYLDYQLLSILTIEDRLKLKLGSKAPEGYTLDKSIPMIKEMMNFTAQSYERAELAEKLVNTCKLNNNFDVLMEVFRYFWERHQNDDKTVRDRFLGSISYRFRLETIGEENEEFWGMAIAQMKRFDMDNAYFEYKDQYLERLIYFKVVKGEDYIDLLRNYVQHVGVYMQWMILEKYPKFGKECIMRIPELLDVFKVEDREYSAVNYLFTINDWNKKFRKYRISPLQSPKVVVNAIKYCKQVYGSSYSVARVAVMSRPQNAQEAVVQDELLATYFKMYDDNICDDMRLWVLKYKPALVLSSPERFFVDTSKLDFYYLLSTMLPSTVHSSIKQIAIDTNVSDETGKICAAVKCLSYYNDFESLAARLDKLNNWEVQKAIIKSCRQVKNIRVALDYCHPNFAPLCLNNIHFILVRLSPNLINDYLKVLFERDPEIRKFAMRVAVDLLGDTEYCDMLKSLWSTETDPDVRKLIVRRTWRHSFNNPNSGLDDLMTAQLQQLDKLDVSMLKFFQRLNRIPRTKFDQISNLVWNWDCYDEKGFNIKYGVVKHECPNDFPFVDEIVKTVLFSTDNKFVEDTHKFIYRYLRSAGDLLESRVRILQDRMMVFGGNTNEVHNLIESICKQSMANISLCSDILSQIMASLEVAIGEADDFFVEMMLKIVKHCILHGTEEMNEVLSENLTETIREMGEEGIEVYAWTVLATLKDIIFIDNTNGLVECVTNLSKFPSDNVKIVSLIMMSSEPEMFNGKFNEILNQMSMGCEGALRAHIAQFLRLHTT